MASVMKAVMSCLVTVLFLALVGVTEAADIDDVTGKQLEAVMETEDFLAVYWYTKNCKTCERVLTVLERVCDEITEAGVTIVKVNDKKAAKAQAIRNFPALTFFKGGDAVQFEGDLMSSDSILDFLASPGSTDLADQIEDVTASQLEGLVHQTTYVAVFFYDKGDKTSINALTALETIDDDLDEHNIAMLKMSDTVEAKNYGIKEFPSLIMYKNRIPELFSGDITNEVKVLEWIFKLAEVEVSSGSLFGMGVAASEIKAPAPPVFKPKVETPTPKVEKAPPKVEKPPPKVEKPPPAVEKAPPKVEKAKVEKPPPLVKETPKPVKLKKTENPPPVKKEPEPEIEEEPEQEKEESATDDTDDTPAPSSDNDDEEESDNITDAIKNGNNVVAFFSEEADTDEAEEQEGEDDQEEAGEDTNDNLDGIAEDQEDEEEVSEDLEDEDISVNELEENNEEDETEEENTVTDDEVEEEEEENTVTDDTVEEEEEENTVTDDAVEEEEEEIVEDISNDEPEAADEDEEEAVDKEPEEALNEEVSEEEPKEDEEEATEEPEEILDDASDGEIDDEEPTTEEDEDLEKEETVDSPIVEEEEEENETFGEWLFGSEDEDHEAPEVIEENVESAESVLSDKLTFSKKREINKADIEEILNDKPEILEELTQYLLGKLLDSKKGEILESVDATDDISEDNDAEEDEEVDDQENEVEETLEEEETPEEEETLEEDSSDVEEDTPAEELSETAELIKTTKSSLIVFFYENLDKISKKIISGIVKVEGHFSGKDVKFLTVDANDMPEMSLPTVPSLVYFKNGQPTVYEENLMNEDAIKAWVELELQSNQDVIEDLSSDQVHSLMEKEEYVMVYIYAPDCEACDEAIKQLEEIDDDADAVGVKFVKTEDADFAQEYGISEFPAIIYFEHEQPSIYDGDAGEETELLTWLLYQMKEDTIENINRELMTKMIEDFEFLAVFFYTNADTESAKVLRHLELIDDEASQYGVRLVKIDDPLMSKKYGHREPPGLGFFRKGNYIKYDGDLLDDEEMLDWLTDPNTMEISDQIEKVNKKMFEKLISRNEFLAVMFYSETDCKQCESVLEELENIDDDAEASGIPIVKLEDKGLAKNIGVFALPAIVFFRNFGEEPTIYAGDLKREDSILEWLLIQKDPSNEAIEDMDGEALRKAIDKSDAVAVFVYTQEGCDTCLPILQALENIDDDTDRQKISMVKTIDAAFAEEVGIDKFPGLVFFKDGVPNLYEGDLMLEEEVLDWLIEMKVESHIELITRPMLESMVEEIQYLAVFFYKQNCRTCDQVIVELENIDDDCDMYGIQMVKLKDPQLAKRYGIKTFPALVYFRNGNPLTYDGDLKNEESVLEWLIDDDNRELEDEIEAVNYRMLDKLLETSPFMAVFFYDDECIECEAILEQLENIDDEADIYGIDFVKNNDPHAAKQYNIYNTPALVYFRKMTPIVYDGDLMDDERILEWLTSQDVFEIKDEIEEVNRKMLEKLLDENEFVAVYFYEDDCPECNEVLEGLERIDDETDALDITFVKINDPRYAKKYGVNKLPALVYFRRKFPSIYRDSLLGESDVLDWLTTNRYKQMELGVFMYAIIALAVTFMFYTAFLMFGLKPREPEKKKEE